MDDYERMAELAGQVKGYLRWAVFLLLAMSAILVIDLQIKRSITRQAEAASRRISTEGAGHGRASPNVAATTDDSSQPRSRSGDAVDGIPGVAEGTDTPPGPKPTRGRGMAQRPESDGP